MIILNTVAVNIIITHIPNAIRITISLVEIAYKWTIVMQIWYAILIRIITIPVHHSPRASSGQSN